MYSDFSYSTPEITATFLLAKKNLLGPVVSQFGNCFRLKDCHTAPNGALAAPHERRVVSMSPPLLSESGWVMEATERFVAEPIYVESYTIRIMATCSRCKAWLVGNAVRPSASKVVGVNGAPRP